MYLLSFSSITDLSLVHSSFCVFDKYELNRGNNLSTLINYVILATNITIKEIFTRRCVINFLN